MSNIILVLGAGANVGLSILRHFSSKGFKTVAVSRSQKDEVTKVADLALQADFTDPKSIKGIFEKAKEKIGVPNVVVYNAAANTMNPDPLSIPLDQFISDTNVVITSGYAAAQESVAAFRSLPKDTTKAFIYTGNALNRDATRFQTLLTFGIGKSGAAHMIEAADNIYSKEGIRFYWGDERTATGAPIGSSIDGQAHADFYYDLVTSKEPMSWDGTFVDGVGYVDFEGKVPR